ncbi:hypothetical protein K2B98_004660 [Vibrio parahaemolyticus]|nr:hypothetical protein [Vibrio parahaemolyticus]ELB2909188.1 hypothetical protein [Vibrio alginolyticus]EGQ9499194.1 hypothetical protein [Vibrio parahaemolyticus]EGQ9507820.1 hypothetical protein [Vibrio parahaemolyticus]EGQ9814143.1 hypothetical protein [Vibrio parahaemolyticus]
MEDKSSHKKQHFSADDVVIIIVFTSTLLLAVGSCTLWFLSEPIVIPPPVISLLLGIAVSSLVYRFLGGVGDASFSMKGIKLGGSAAVLIVVALWSNSELKHYVPVKDQAHTPLDLSQHVIPAKDKWYAVDVVNGSPIELEFPLFSQSHKPPPHNTINEKLSSRTLNLNEVSSDKFHVVFENGNKQILGALSPDVLNKMGYFDEHSLTMSAYQVETFSATQKIDINTNLPFIVETKGFGNNFTKYKLLDRSDDKKVIHEGAILLRNAEIVKINNKHYLVSVIEVNHQVLTRSDGKTINPYAKIYVAEIIVKNV